MLLYCSISIAQDAATKKIPRKTGRRSAPKGPQGGLRGDRQQTGYGAPTAAEARAAARRREACRAPGPAGDTYTTIARSFFYRQVERRRQQATLNHTKEASAAGHEGQQQAQGALCMLVDAALSWGYAASQPTRLMRGRSPPGSAAAAN